MNIICINPTLYIIITVFHCYYEQSSRTQAKKEISRQPICLSDYEINHPYHHYTHQFIFHTQFCLVDLSNLICNCSRNHSNIQAILIWVFLLCPGTYTFGFCVKIFYCINFKSWMKYCECWQCDNMRMGMLIPISISVYLHRKNILCFNNQFPRSYNFSIKCCVILQCVCF